MICLIQFTNSAITWLDARKLSTNPVYTYTIDVPHGDLLLEQAVYNELARAVAKVPTVQPVYGHRYAGRRYRTVSLQKVFCRHTKRERQIINYIFADRMKIPISDVMCVCYMCWAPRVFVAKYTIINWR